MGSIDKIKKVINSLEIRIEDEDLNTLERLLVSLEKDVMAEGDVLTIFKMVQSTSRYLISKGKTAHPDTVPLLSTLIQDFEIFIDEPGRSETELRGILAKDIQSFKSLKAGIATFSPLSQKEIEELKAVILSVDWEISTETLESFDRVITRLKEKLKSNKLHYAFLRIMHSTGGYIARNKASAEKGSINLLQSVFLDYEKLVLNPGMPPEDKKQMIESNIKIYNEFKAAISGWDETDPVPTQDDDQLPPALSHIDSAPAEGSSASLSTLPEPLEGEDEFSPALFAEQKKETQPRDVMGDLFSPKTTPADELLDEIHMAELHGPGHQNPMDLVTAQGEADSAGVKNFIPQRSGGAPIPEIESRLDEFFNLDVSENGLTELSEDQGEEETPVLSEEIEAELTSVSDPEIEQEPAPALGPELVRPDPGPLPELEIEQEIEPALGPELTGQDPEPAFGPEMVEQELQPAPGPELVERELDPLPEPELPMELLPDDGIELIEPPVSDDIPSRLIDELRNDPGESILERLKTLMNEPAGLAGEEVFSQIQEDLIQLTQLWTNETDKTLLVGLISSLSRYIHELGENTPENQFDGTGAKTDTEVGDTPLEADVPETLFGEETMADENESAGDDESKETLVDTELFDEEIAQEDASEQDLLEKEPPKGFWGKIKSIFRK